MPKYKVILRHEGKKPNEDDICSCIGDDAEALALAAGMELGIVGDDAVCWAGVEAYPGLYGSGAWIVKVKDAE